MPTGAVTIVSNFKIKLDILILAQILIFEDCKYTAYSAQLSNLAFFDCHEGQWGKTNYFEGQKSYWPKTLWLGDMERLKCLILMVFSSLSSNNKLSFTKDMSLWTKRKSLCTVNGLL